jgi:hypothetical protein
MKKAIFTVCAKNYLGQALTLKESCLRWNSDIVFFIFLSDASDDNQVDSLVLLDDSWIPEWRKMAFKYDVIEFSTSIKPFCFRKLFNDGYDIVVYLDPDIYVLKPLTSLWQDLEQKSIVLTPHRCDSRFSDTGYVKEEVGLRFGVYNLGFLGLRKGESSISLIDWWCWNLFHKGYNETLEGLFVDQKWMNWAPAYFPDDVLISHHLGYNTAIWNIHERDIVVKDGEFYCQSKTHPEHVDPLVFFHFSSFNPNEPAYLNKVDRDVNTEAFPQLKPLLDEYATAELRNRYNEFRKTSYSFNEFDDGTPISSINRRLYRSYEDRFATSANPFSSKEYVYQVFKANGLLLKKPKTASGKSVLTNSRPAQMNSSNEGAVYKLNKLLFFLFKLIGFDRFNSLLPLGRYLSDRSKYTFLIKNWL